MKNRVLFIAFTIICLCNSGKGSAQTFAEYERLIQTSFQQYKTKKELEFKAYRDRINAEFAEFMRQVWPEYETQPALPVPDSPEPPAPAIKDPDKEPSNDPIPFDKVIPVPKPVEPPQPVVPIPIPEPAPEPETPEPNQEPQPTVPVKPKFNFTFYGQKCHIPLEDKHRFRLKNATENSFADGWMILSSDEYLPVIAHCLDYRDKLCLCDWGYVRFVEQMTTAFFSSGQENEAKLMQMYILTQSGYKVRIAKAGSRLVLLLPSTYSIYKYPYLNVRGVNYYLVDSSLGKTTVNIFDQEFPKEQYFSLRIHELPVLPVNRTANRHFQSKHNQEIAADISVNKNLIDFYNDYPLSGHWDIYSNISLSQQAKERLYPVLKQSIAGKSSPDAANILLHFVQTAFEYATDEEQFGTERPLFADETLFYPYSDCEDRAILYSILVRELLGLDVVLLHYPGHLATAVCFDTNDVFGDYLQIDGRRYIICDPTYINANIGETMQQYKQTAASVIKTKS